MGSNDDVKNIVVWWSQKYRRNSFWWSTTHLKCHPPNKPSSWRLGEINLVKVQSAFTNHNTLLERPSWWNDWPTSFIISISDISFKFIHVRKFVIRAFAEASDFKWKGDKFLMNVSKFNLKNSKPPWLYKQNAD